MSAVLHPSPAGVLSFGGPPIENLVCSEEPCTDTGVAVRTLTSPPFTIVLPSPGVDLIAREIAKTGTWDADVAVVFQHVLSAGPAAPALGDGFAPVVVDVGANVGFFSLYSASMGWRVHSFEPQPRLVSYLRASLALNTFHDSRPWDPTAATGAAGEGAQPWEERVSVHRNIVSADNDPSGAKKIVYKEGNFGGAYVVDARASDPGATAAQVRLDSIITGPVKLLKIDVEGFEGKVFRSAEALFRGRLVENLVLEIRCNEQTTRDDAQFMLTTLFDSGYDVFEIKGFEVAQYPRVTAAGSVEFLGNLCEHAEQFTNLYACVPSSVSATL